MKEWQGGSINTVESRILYDPMNLFSSQIEFLQIDCLLTYIRPLHIAEFSLIPNMVLIFHYMMLSIYTCQMAQVSESVYGLFTVSIKG